MANLDRFVYYACGVVNFDTLTIEDSTKLLESFYKFCESYNRISKFYFILHDETNVIHIHFIYYLSAQCRLMTIFNKMREWFVDKYHLTRNAEGINISKCESINAHLRYIVHQDESSKREGKKLYQLEDIVSNDDIDIIEGLINSRKGDIDAYYLRDAVLDTDGDFELMNKLGLKVFHKYRYEIEIIKDNRVMLKAQRDAERLEKNSEGVPF